MITLRTLSVAFAALFTLASPLMAEEHADGLHVHDAYARAAGMGKSGAVFFVVHNNTETDERLADARADVAKKVELHTHKDMGDGVMKMMHVPEGFAIPAGEIHELARGGDHVMLMGLTADLKNGDTFPLTLVFDQAGEVTIEVTVDNDRQASPMQMQGGHMQHDHAAHGMKSGG